MRTDGKPRGSDGAPQRFYRPELDGLRFFAFLAVFVHHWLWYGPEWYEGIGLPRAVGELLAATAKSGAYGVDLFFVLSAYLITELLIRERIERGTLDAARFYARRALRIWPLYFIFLSVTLWVVPLFLADSLDGHTAAFGLFMANWSAAFLGYPGSVAAPLWSISIEEQFYAVQPWIVRYMGRASHWWALIVSLLAIALGTRALLVHVGARHPAIWCNTFARLDPIALGMALAVIARSATAGSLLKRSRTAGLIGGVLAFPAVSYLVSVDASPPGWGLVPSYTVVAVAACLVVTGAMNSKVLRTMLSATPLVYLGRISYGLYVFHALGLVVARAAIARLAPEGIGPVSLALLPGGLGLVVTVALSMVSWHVLEKPVLRFKGRFEVVGSRPCT